MLVGRESEISLLAERIGEQRAVAVLGEAGVGKTALVRAAAERAGTRLYEAGALATLSWLPYLPLRRAFAHDFEGDAAYVGATVEAELGEALLFMDDVQWADTQTTALLPLLAGRIALVAAVRRGDPSTPAALDAAAAAGAELLPLEPLPEAEAAELARALHPELSETATKRLVERSGGNPFLLEQLAATGEPSDSLRLTLAARVRELTPAGRDAIAALALLGRPAQPRMLGTGAAEIVASGLATANGEVTIRHALLAETTVEMLPERERRRAHSRIAAGLDDVGEASRHHAAAGERALALEKALLAVERATTPGERAAHLGVAAAVATGTEANEIRIRAATALLEAGRASDADAVLVDVDADDRLVGARACLLRWQALLARHDVAGARAAWERGITLAAGTRSDVELDLRVEEARVISSVVVDDGDLRALAAAEAALVLARERGIDHPRAHEMLGACRLEAGAPGWESELVIAVELARGAGDLQTLVSAGRTLAYGYLVTGRVAQGCDFVHALAEEARQLHLLGPERLFRVYLGGFHLHSGSPAAAAEEVEEVLAEALEPTVGTIARCWLSEALIELGRYDEARPVVENMLATAPSDHWSYGSILWALADLEFFSGRLREAVAAADECLARLPGEGPSIFVKLTRCWAALELGLELGDPMPRPFHAMAEAAPLEEAGVRALAVDAPAEAAELLARAAALWRGRHSRGELRSLWGAGEALRRAGEHDAAVEHLVAAEGEAIARGALAHVSRIRRSLRLAGVRRAAGRTRAGDLTGREAEVLDLVGDGLTNDEIARRLGLGRPTVVRLIRSAQQKLGAESRTQAAALAARR